MRQLRESHQLALSYLPVSLGSNAIAWYTGVDSLLLLLLLPTAASRAQACQFAWCLEFASKRNLSLLMGASRVSGTVYCSPARLNTKFGVILILEAPCIVQVAFACLATDLA